MAERQPKRRFVVTEVVGDATTVNNNRYVTCRLEGQQERLAIWGKPGHNTQHIDAFYKRVKGGFPVVIECEWIPPTSQYWFDEHGHHYWAYERFAFEISN